jgi:superfamily I DNA/RNA helicase/RecB family exonuclease
MTDVPERSAYQLQHRRAVAAAAPVLDAAQQQVVDHRRGPLLVLAGPGTGKTTTLVEAAVARVTAGVPVEQILMVTFSRRAAGELRDRVTARLARTVREPVARTLHSYAFGVLRMAAVARGEPAPRLLSGPEQDVIVRELIAGGLPERWPVALRPALRTRAFAGELRDLIMRAVERGLDGPALSDLGRARGRADWVAAGEFLEEYQRVNALENPNGYDPAELIRAAHATLLDDPQLLARERGTRRRIFVDEYQDTDPAQAQLLALLASGADEVILVGDPDQTIYAFRGADVSAIRDVDARFGGGAAVPTVALRQCRRSGAELLAATRRVAALLPGPAAQRRLESAPGLPPGQVHTALFRSASEEAAYLAGTLRRAHLDGLPWARIAVLVRSTTTVLATLRRALTTAGVPVAVRGEDLPLAEQPAVAMLLEVLGCVLEPSRLDEDVAQRLLLGPIGGGDSVYLRRLRRVLRQLDGRELLAPALADEQGAAVLPAHVRGPVQRVARVLAAGAAARRGAAGGPAGRGGVEELLWAVWSATGLSNRWEAASRAGGVAGAAADRDLDAVVELFDAAARFTDRLPAAGAREFAEHLAAQEVPGDPLRAGPPAEGAVAVLTAHAAKGLEWDLVCVAGVQEGRWPDLRRRGSLLGSEQLVDALAGRDGPGLSSFAPQLAEERRLFYVAATRARRRLLVTAVLGDEEQPSRFLDEIEVLPLGAEREVTPALRGVHLPGLVAELRAVVCDPGAAGDDRQAAAGELARLAEAGVPGAAPEQWWGLAPLSSDAPVVRPDRPVPVSPSRLEAFLRCEVRALLLDLGARDTEQVSASLGTLVHELAATLPADAPLAQFEQALDERWHELDFGAPWYADNERARATAMVRLLVDWLRASRAEFELVGVEQGFAVDVGDARVTGRVDRVERDERGRLVIVDLKTGKHKPAKEELPTHPQLAAYQLAVRRGAFGSEGEPGGALLVQLGGNAKNPEQRQPPLAESDDPEWIDTQLARVAERMRGSRFTATAGSDCRRCDVRASCPLQADGRQVTG